MSRSKVPTMQEQIAAEVVELLLKALQPTPETWSYRNWPKGMAPYDGDAAKRVFRLAQKELIKAKAVARPSKELVFFRDEYLAWLRSKGGKKVLEYETLWNNPDYIAKRKKGA